MYVNFLSYLVLLYAFFSLSGQVFFLQMWVCVFVLMERCIAGQPGAVY